ncbi:MAG: SDR family NAD(P)-dependent oxidoreductase [Mesorhizobium sp.]
MNIDRGREFAGKVALVTGGGSGIGAAICRTLAERGASVVVGDVNAEAAQATARELQAASGGQAIGLAMDVADAAACEAAVRAATDRFGALHLAVNNAGIGTPRGNVHEQSVEDWSLSLQVNLTGVFLSMRAEIPAMLESGGGAIVNISSICGVIGVKQTAAYTAAKHGVIGLTKVAALDYATKGIRVNALCPGYVYTPFIAGRSEEERAEIASRHPVERLADAQEMANVAAFLLSDEARFITGAAHLADGGYTAR